MDSSNFKRFMTVFWRKPLGRRFRFVYYIMTAVCLCMILVIPTYISTTFWKNHSADTELKALLESDAQSVELKIEIRKELKEYDRLQAELEAVDPNSVEYESIKKSFDELRLNIAGRVPALVKSYDEENLPVLMTYNEYVKTTIK